MHLAIWKIARKCFYSTKKQNKTVMKWLSHCPQWYNLKMWFLEIRFSGGLGSTTLMVRTQWFSFPTWTILTPFYSAFPLSFRRVWEIFQNYFFFLFRVANLKMHWIYTFQLYMLKDERQLIGGLEEIDQKAFISCLQFSTMFLTVIENISWVLGASPVYC